MPDPVATKPPKWPMIACLLLALILWGLYFLARLDHEAIAAGDKSSIRTGLGASIVFLFGGLIAGAILRDMFKKK
jgi:hypothetical protein